MPGKITLGFCAAEVNPAGPVQLQVVGPAAVVAAVKVSDGLVQVRMPLLLASAVTEIAATAQCSDFPDITGLSGVANKSLLSKKTNNSKQKDLGNRFCI